MGICGEQKIRWINRTWEENQRRKTVEKNRKQHFLKTPKVHQSDQSLKLKNGKCWKTCLEIELKISAVVQ